MFKKILIANRGEIACRVIKTARKMGIKTVAVYSDADRDAAARGHGRRSRPHRPAARRPNPIWSSTRSSRPASRPGAEAVHPGYGFLSEREAFPVALAEGRDRLHRSQPQGDRRHGRQDREQEGRRCGQGLDRPGLCRRDRRHQARRQDRRGDRLSRDDEGLRRRRRQGHAHRLQPQGGRRRLPAGAVRGQGARSATTACSSRSSSSIRATSRSSCIGDKHGNVVYLGERECSIQRRNQKVIEEAPSPLLDEKTRRAMGEQAVALAKAVGYDSAGTVEFVAGQDRSFFFLEMNTRLQVEHPVTELITGVDLVELMIRVGGRREAALQAVGREDQRLGGREPRLCRGPVPQLPAVHRPPGEVSPAGRGRRQRHHRAQRHRRRARAARSRCSTIR